MLQRPRTILVVLGLAAGVCALAVAGLTLRSTPPETEPANLAMTPNETSAGGPAATEAGLRAFVDPETGRLRDATAEELARSAAQAPRPRFKSSEGIEIVEHADGMRSAVLDERFMSTSVAKIGPDGRLVTECFDSEAEVRAFLEGAETTPALEVR